MQWTKILVRATNWLGDAILALPALRALRARFPKAQITVLARPWVADLYRREPCCDQVLLCQGRRRLVRELRALRFDAAILLPNAFEAALLVRMAGIPRRIGYNRDHRAFLLTDAIPLPKPGAIPPHQVFYYLELLRRAAILDAMPPTDSIELHGAEQARRVGQRTFDEMGFRGQVIGISPGAQNSRAKQWLPERFAEAAVQVARALEGAVAIFGSAQERMLAQGVAEAIRRAGRPVLNLAGETTLERFVELAAACRVFLTNDSGAMHVAAALDVPTVAIFGPSIEAETGPLAPRARVVREPVECSFCMLRDCPTDHRCMTRISAERVAQVALELLQ
jgi:heptosyltransferase-2